MIETLITLGIILIAAIPPIWYFRRNRNLKKISEQKFRESRETGRMEPVSLHPLIDPNVCIGTAACVPACPEGDILGIIRGRGELVEPSNCIGHGECFRACPVEAISLVFGTERRGVDIPHLKENFETNVPGVYIVGELGGMGLIRNAVTQGRQVIEYLAPALKKQQYSNDSVTDVVVVGAGPAGLAATAQAIDMGLSYTLLDQNDVGGTILSYPRQKIVMTQPMEMPIYGKTNFREISKEELLELWYDIIDRTDMTVQANQKVEDVRRENGHFRVITQQGNFTGKKVILAIGRRGTPRKLGVPGEDTSKVTYQLQDPEQYRGKKCLVVGGGDSAVEAALQLADEPGTEVTISYRKDAFSRIKRRNLERINDATENGLINVIWNSNVTKIHPDSVDIEAEGDEMSIGNDFVFIFIGGIMPSGFLNTVGIEVETKFGEA
ncbi:MAG: NAD(P)-binding domain-containing protein [Candidatus Marinimicrobia bacterium]|nr:NAD(P)-binding domain-containing protein [Candidatus Neomarinimicrobiota bacterium]MCF7828647.1 NAD(P)-binding domain-containing protein [Candidatus Neomarinimicrobiota bacterium]MCF7880388.1 NAD(P)-binding domain-containing protein [Candidatus Neomarinimicrobiota bacterium]